MVRISRLLRPLAIGTMLALTACGGGAEPEGEGEADTAPAASVRVAQAEIRPIQSFLYAQGTARATRREFLSFQQAGRVTYLRPGLEVGDYVRQGQLIARVEPARAQSDFAQAEAGLAGARTELSVAQATLAEARAQLELARATFERFAILLEQNSASQQEYDEAEAQLEQARAAVRKAEAQVAANRAQIGSARAQVSAAQVGVSDTRIVAPISGQVARLNIERGRYFAPDLVQAGDESAALSSVPVVLINASAFEITVDVPSFSSGSVSVGDEALIRSNEGMAGGPSAQGGNRGSGGAAAVNLPPNADSEFVIRGEVTAVSPSLDPMSRTFQVKIRTTSGARELRDGEFVSLWIGGSDPQEALAIPAEAIRYADNRPFTFVYNRETKKVERRELELGQGSSDLRAVISGIRRGEWVVTAGNGRIDDGDSVRVIGRSGQTTRPKANTQ